MSHSHKDLPQIRGGARGEEDRRSWRLGLPSPADALGPSGRGECALIRWKRPLPLRDWWPNTRVGYPGLVTALPKENIGGGRGGWWFSPSESVSRQSSRGIGEENSVSSPDEEGSRAKGLPKEVQMPDSREALIGVQW